MFFIEREQNVPSGRSEGYLDSMKMAAFFYYRTIEIDARPPKIALQKWFQIFKRACTEAKKRRTSSKCSRHSYRTVGGIMVVCSLVFFHSHTLSLAIERLRATIRSSVGGWIATILSQNMMLKKKIEKPYGNEWQC